MARPIVVTGARGIVGSHVVTRLLEAGQVVWALSRNPSGDEPTSGVQVIQGDLDEPSTLLAALEGAGALVLVARPDTAEEVVAIAEQAGIEQVVVISSAAVTAGYDTTWHLPVERAVRASSMAWSIVRPGEFAINSLWIWGPSIRQRRRVVEPFPDQVGSPVHERDVADIVVANLLDVGRRNRVDTVVGPDWLSKRQQVAAIAAAIEATIAVDVATPEEAREFYLAQGGFAGDNAEFLFGYESYDGVSGEQDESVDQPRSIYQTIDEILGRPARTYVEWVGDHVAEFRSGP